MRDSFRDVEHLLRLALLFAVGLGAFLVLRVIFVPRTFGELGHYRAGALADERGLPLGYAGRQACGDCHDDKAKTLAGGVHAKLGCEACHGPLAAHVADPDSVKPVLPQAPALCLECHSENVAKPKGFPQIDPAKHNAGNVCTDCHDPHSPL